MTDPVTPSSSWTGWRTFLFNCAIMAALAIVGYAQSQNWVDIVPKNHPELALLIGGAIAAANAYLRTLTYTSVFKSTSPAPFPLPK